MTDIKKGTIPAHIAARGKELHDMRAYIICYRPNPELVWGNDFTPLRPEMQIFTDIRRRDKVLNYLQSAKINGEPLYIIHLNIIQIDHYLSFQKEKE